MRIVQVNLPHAQDLKYLHLNKLMQALQDDADLAREKLGRAYQMVFICSEYDYISYFSGLGKAVFL